MDPGRLAELLWGTVVHRPYVYAFLLCCAPFAVAQLGARRAATFGATAWLVAFSAEYSSTRNGFPFGPYRYFDETRARELWISNVPFWDSLSFVFLSYVSLALAAALLRREADRLRRPEAGLLHPAAPLLGATLMMLLDVVIDPVALQGDKWFLGRIYDYPWRGFYFGVTAANFAGWWLVGAATQWHYQREVALLPWCRGGWRPVGPRFEAGIFGIYAGVLLFNLGVTIAIGDVPLALASGGVTVATLGVAGWRLRRQPRAGRVVVCAATETEAAACRRGVAASGIDGVSVLRTGVGPERAARALARRLAGASPPPLVVSAGFAGAIGGDVAVGEVVTARAVYESAPPRHRPVALPRAALRALPGARPVDVVSAGAVVARAAPERAPAVVDMETAALAEAAAAAGAPFAVLRVVTDTPAAPLPAVARAAGAALAARGVLRRAALAAGVMREAARAPGEALALARASRGWARALEAALRAHAAALVAGAGAPEPRDQDASSLGR